jgi:hypothetical protein
MDDLNYNNQFMIMAKSGQVIKYKLPEVLKFMHEGKEFKIERITSPQFITLHGWGDSFHNDFIKNNARIYEMITNKEEKSNPCFGELIITGDKFTHFIHEYLVEHILRFYNVDESIINSFTHIEYHNITRVSIFDSRYIELHIRTNKINASKFVKKYGKDDVSLRSYLDDPVKMNFGVNKNDIMSVGLNYGTDMWVNIELVYLMYTWSHPPIQKNGSLEWNAYANELKEITFELGHYSSIKWYSFYEEIPLINNSIDILKNAIKNVCSICLDEIHCRDGYITPCGHNFHKKCIRDYFLLNMCNNCPECRCIFRIVVSTIPKKTIKKYRKLLAPIILKKREECKKFFNKHYITRFDDLF